jgi:hypothetical protein
MEEVYEGFIAYFEELIVDRSTWNPLEARHCTFDSSHAFFDGDVPLSWAYFVENLYMWP